METVITQAQFNAKRQTLAAKEADHAACKAEVDSMRDAILLVAHQEYGLPSIHALIDALHRVSRGVATDSVVSAEVKAQVRIDLAAKLSDEEIMAKYTITRRVLGGIKASVSQKSGKNSAQDSEGSQSSG